MSLEKEFVPYELSVKLKELGFDEECLAYYHEPSRIIERFQYSERPVKNSSNWNDMFTVYVAPLWQQAFTFIISKINLSIDRNRHYVITFDGEYSLELHDWQDYEGWDVQTITEGNIKTLEKLIEIISCSYEN